MSDIDRVVALFEDVSITEASPKDEFTLTLKDDEVPFDLIDKKTLELLELVQEYEHLMKDLNINLTNGFLTLSRANYSNRSFVKSYGPASLDLRPCRASKVLNYTDKYEIINLLNENGLGTSHGETFKDDQNAQKNEATSVKNRKVKSSSDTKEKTRGIIDLGAEEVPIKDPIKQFGGIPHFLLRKSQQHFKKVLEDAINIVNLRNKIDKGIRDLEKLNGV